jgi:L-idonate 5-dehydrogenase
MKFYGSAMPFPHIQGAFRETLIAEDYQCVPADGLSPEEAAMAEPLAVCLHAIKQAGNIFGKKVLITGSGPIGTLSVLSARRAGAEEILVTDISDQALKFSSSVGADKVINTAKNYDQIEKLQVNKGFFDLAIECSGSASGINDAIKSLKPKGTLIQLGLGGDILMPLVSVTTKELNLKGSFRFHSEFQLAVKMMKKKLIDVKPLITHSIPFLNAEEGFNIAMNDHENSMKVQLKF